VRSALNRKCHHASGKTVQCSNYSSGANQARPAIAVALERAGRLASIAHVFATWSRQTGSRALAAVSAGQIVPASKLTRIFKRYPNRPGRPRCFRAASAEILARQDARSQGRFARDLRVKAGLCSACYTRKRLSAFAGVRRLVARERLARSGCAWTRLGEQKAGFPCGRRRTGSDASRRETPLGAATIATTQRFPPTRRALAGPFRPCFADCAMPGWAARERLSALAMFAGS